MGLILVFLGLLLGINWISWQGLVFIPSSLLNALESLGFYGVIGIGLLLLAWIVGDET